MVLHYIKDLKRQKKLDCFNWKKRFSVFINFNFPQDWLVTLNEDLTKKYAQSTILSKIDFHFSGTKEKKKTSHFQGCQK